MASWGRSPKYRGWSQINPQRRKPQIFTKTVPAVNCHFLVLASAWPRRAQYTQNYNVITQAGAHGEHNHLARRTPGQEGTKAIRRLKSHVFIFLAEGGWNTISMKIALWIIAWESFGKGLRRVFLFQRGLFPPQGLREMGRERRLLLLFSEADLGCCSDNVWQFLKQISMWRVCLCVFMCVCVCVFYLNNSDPVW